MTFVASKGLGANRINAATKAGVWSFARTLTTNPRQRRICVNAIYQNRVVVALASTDLSHLDPLGRNAEQFAQHFDHLGYGSFFAGRLHYLTRFGHLNGLPRPAVLS